MFFPLRLSSWQDGDHLCDLVGENLPENDTKYRQKQSDESENISFYPLIQPFLKPLHSFYKPIFSLTTYSLNLSYLNCVSVICGQINPE